MADIKILIVVDGIFSLTTSYPIDATKGHFSSALSKEYGADAWFTISHLIQTLRNSTSPTFTVDTASRGFNAAGTFVVLEGSSYISKVTNDTPDPDATYKGPDPSKPTPFLFDVQDLTHWDEIWLFGLEGYDGLTAIGPPLPPGSGEPGALKNSELKALTTFMEQGGGIFAVGDHSGLGAGMCGNIPRVRYMRKWFAQSDPSSGLPPLQVPNWPGSTIMRLDTLMPGPDDPFTDSSSGKAQPALYFDNQSDDIPQKLDVLLPDHPAIQGTNGALGVYPDHMHEGEVIVPDEKQLSQTASDPTLMHIVPAGFHEFPTVGGHQEVPKILAQSQSAGGIPGGHETVVPKEGTTSAEDRPCESPNFNTDTSLCQTITNNAALAAYDGHTVNVGRIITDSSFHHFLDLNLRGDPCSKIPTKQKGFTASASGKAHLKELSAFYVNMATWLSWIDKKFYFVMGQNSYGRDEVADTKKYPGAFYLFLEGYSPNVLGSSRPTLTGSFLTKIPGLSISKTPKIIYDMGDKGANASVIQRIRFEYQIDFTSASLDSFPKPPDTTTAFTLDANLDVQGKALPTAEAEFFLLKGQDPHFTNINDTARGLPYLSQDLRVFTINSGDTVAGETLSTADPNTLNPSAGYDYIKKLITRLNSKYGYLNTTYSPPDTNKSDPLDGVLPDQNGALNGDSTVTKRNGHKINYNFAIARVRLKGASGDSRANNVRVFFRLFTSQTFDTDFINSPIASSPNVTYPPSGSNPTFPQPGTNKKGNVNGCSLPFFADANFVDGPGDYDSGGANNHNIPGDRDDVWAFYGCFLNVYDKNNTYAGQDAQSWLPGSGHCCLVAQIAYPDAPIENTGGVIESPENSDKLAQRNLQVNPSGNPGFPATHLVPQTFDARPSPPPQSESRLSLLGYPDEMMIDWGETPAGSVAQVYWPGADVGPAVQLAKQLYPGQGLAAADAHTLEWTVASEVTYIPIPFGTGSSFAGLLTVRLPDSVRRGEEFDVVVRRITTKSIAGQVDPNQPADTEVNAVVVDAPVWRYISGSFLARISVQDEKEILPVDENLLAVLKWRLDLIGPTNRWYPVLERYIGCLSGRIVGMGGNPAQIPASPEGYQTPAPVPFKPYDERCCTGKVIGICYDRFGDFEGFTILSEAGREHRFRGREPKVEELVRRAWIERSVLTVCVDLHHPEWPASIVLDRWK